MKLKKPTNVYIVIPCFNACKTIESVLSDIRHHLPDAGIIVINDGSTDNCHPLLSKNRDCIYIAHSRNFGKGASLLTGFREAMRLSADIIITMDADRQHSAADAKKLMTMYCSHENFDIVIGSRMWNTQSMPIHRILSNVITSKLITWRVGKRIEDSQSGLRLYKAKVLKNLDIKTQRFDAETELLLKLLLYGYKITFVAIDTRYFDSNRSYIKFIDILRFVRVYLSSFFWRTNIL